MLGVFAKSAKVCEEVSKVTPIIFMVTLGAAKSHPCPTGVVRLSQGQWRSQTIYIGGAVKKIFAH